MYASQLSGVRCRVHLRKAVCLRLKAVRHSALLLDIEIVGYRDGPALLLDIETGQVTWRVLFSTTTQVRLGQVTWLLVIGLLGGSLGAPWGLRRGSLGVSAGAPWGLPGAPRELRGGSAGAPRGLLGDLSGASGLPGGSVGVPRGPSDLARFTYRNCEKTK